MNSRPRIIVAAVGLAFVLAIVLGATGVFTPKSQRVALGASTTLSIISGEVQIRHGATGDFTAADDGAILGPGDTIRTAAGARAVLTYFEGSTVEIEPGTELAIQTAHGNPDGSTVIVMEQELGTTWHVVSHLVQGASKYEVRTTASTASVRGTQFTVGVVEDLSTSITTTEGNVATSDAGATTTVEVTQGLITTTKKGEAPAPPKPAPEPERKVTVTVTDQNTLVVDTLGRANGIKNGKKIVQTPGAQVSIVDGKLVITLPNIPDGDVVTHFQNTSKSDDVEVTTKVEDRGKKPVEVTETVKPSTTNVTGVELKRRGDTGSAGAGSTDGPSVNLKRNRDIKEPKVGGTVPTPTTEDQQKATELENNKGTNGTTENGAPTVNTRGTPPTGTEDRTKDDQNKTNKQSPPNGFAPGGLVPVLPITTPTGNNRDKPGDTSGDKPDLGPTNIGPPTNGASGFLPRVPIAVPPTRAVERTAPASRLPETNGTRSKDQTDSKLGN